MKIKTAIIAALPEEVEQLSLKHKVTISGVGKVNAAIAAKELLQSNPDIKLIINIGTVGSSKYPVGSIFRVGKFCDRDYSDAGLGLNDFFSSVDFSSQLNNQDLQHHSEITCATGDTFVQSLNDFDLVDMEAYGIARVGKQHNTSVLSIKYVSDGCDLSSAEVWKQALKIAQAKLFSHFSEIENQLEII